jgi:hypothetical protein
MSWIISNRISAEESDTPQWPGRLFRAHGAAGDDRGGRGNRVC